MEFNFIQKANKTLPIDSENGEEDNDLITLTGCGQITQWRFPQTTRCPLRNCRADPGFRSLTIDHYRKRHAKNFTLCALCDKPVSAKQIWSVILHYRTKHPNDQLPAYVTEREPEVVN